MSSPSSGKETYLVPETSKWHQMRWVTTTSQTLIIIKKSFNTSDSYVRCVYKISYNNILSDRQIKCFILYYVKVILKYVYGVFCALTAVLQTWYGNSNATKQIREFQLCFWPRHHSSLFNTKWTDWPTKHFFLSSGSSIWHPPCRQAAKQEEKSKVGWKPLQAWYSLISQWPGSVRHFQTIQPRLE